MSETTNLKLFKQDNPTTNTNNFDIEKTLNDNWDKLDENAGTTNKKLESLEKVDSTNKWNYNSNKRRTNNTEWKYREKCRGYSTE